MSGFDQLLESIGVKSFDELTPDERKTYAEMAKIASQRPVTIEDFKVFISNLRISLDNTIAVDDLSRDRDLALKARLKNLIVIEAFLYSPERAKAALESYINGIAKK